MKYNKAERKELVNKIRELAGDEDFHLAEGKMLDEETIIKIAENFPDREDFNDAVQVLIDKSNDLDVKYIKVLEARETLKQTFNSELYEKALSDAASKEEIRAALNQAFTDKYQIRFVEDIKEDKSAFIANFHKDKILNSGIIRDVKVKDYFKEVANSLLSGAKGAGSGFYKAGCQMMKSAAAGIKNVFEAIRNKTSDIKNWGVGIMKNIATFTAGSISKINDKLYDLGTRLQKMNEKANAFIKAKGMDIKARLIENMGDMYDFRATDLEMGAKIDSFNKKIYESGAKFFGNVALNITNTANLREAVQRQWKAPDMGDCARTIKNLGNVGELTTEQLNSLASKVILERSQEPIRTPLIARVLTAPLKAISAGLSRLAGVSEKASVRENADYIRASVKAQDLYNKADALREEADALRDLVRKDGIGGNEDGNGVEEPEEIE